MSSSSHNPPRSHHLLARPPLGFGRKPLPILEAKYQSLHPQEIALPAPPTAEVRRLEGPRESEAA